MPPELACFDHASGTWTRHSGFNDRIVEGRVFPDVRTIRWEGEDGTQIEGLLMTPPGADGPLPLIVCVHGGPTWSWGAYFSDSEPNAVLLSSAGYACLLPNPRGSIGRGHEFAQGVIGDGGGIDYRDIMAGVDHCIAEGTADPDRLGISGLSYGGYMAGWAVGQTDRFGAAVAMSVVSNYVSFHLTSEVWWYDQAILKVSGTTRPVSTWSARRSRTRTGARHRPSSSRGRRIGARRSGRPRSSSTRSRPRGARSSSSRTRGKGTCRWNGATRSTRSNARRPGSTDTFVPSYACSSRREERSRSEMKRGAGALRARPLRRCCVL
jgi:hypothetical protein